MRLQRLARELPQARGERVLDRRPVPGQLLEHGQAAERRDRRGVAALVRQDEPSVAQLPGERDDRAGHEPERVRVQQHPRERVEAVGVEAAGDDDELRPERAQRRLDDARHRVEVGALARPRRQRDVDRASRAVALPGLLERAGGQQAPVLVQRDGQDVGLGPEGVLRPVAVMDVPVDDRDAAHPAHRPRVHDGQRDVPEDAEARAGLGHRVVAGRPDERVAGLHGAVEHGVDGGHRPARREPGDVVGAGAGPGVEADRAADALRQRADALEVLARVEAQQLVLGREPRGHGHEVLEEARDLDEVAHAALRRRRLGHEVARLDPAPGALDGGAGTRVVPHVALVPDQPGAHGGYQASS